MVLSVGTVIDGVEEYWAGGLGREWIHWAYGSWEGFAGGDCGWPSGRA